MLWELYQSIEGCDRIPRFRARSRNSLGEPWWSQRLPPTLRSANSFTLKTVPTDPESCC